MASTSSAAGLEAEDPKRLFQELNEALNVMVEAYNAADNMNTVHIATVQYMSRVQIPMGQIISMLASSYTRGMPLERQEKCKGICNKWRSVAEMVLEFTPEMSRSLRDKMTAAQLLKLIHEQLKNAPNPVTESDISPRLQELKNRATAKLRDCAAFDQTKLDNIQQAYQDIIVDIVTEIQALGALSQTCKDILEAAKQTEFEAKGLAAVGLCLAAVEIFFGVGSFCVGSYCLVNGAMPIHAHAHGLIPVFVVAKKSTVDPMATTFLGGSLLGLGARSGQDRLEQLQVACSRIGEQQERCSSLLERVSDLEQRYRELRANMNSADARAIILKNFCAQIIGDSEYFCEQLDLWVLIQSEHFGRRVGDYIEAQEPMNESINDLAKQTRKQFAQWAKVHEFPHEFPISELRIAP